MFGLVTFFYVVCGIMTDWFLWSLGEEQEEHHLNSNERFFWSFFWPLTWTFIASAVFRDPND
jgi:hypothetical protein